MGIDSTVLYYSLEAMGQINRLHAKIFDAAHVQKIVLGNPAALKIASAEAPAKAALKKSTAAAK